MIFSKLCGPIKNPADASFYQKIQVGLNLFAAKSMTIHYFKAMSACFSLLQAKESQRQIKRIKIPPMFGLVLTLYLK